MTMPAYVEELGGTRLPSASEKAAANQLRQILASHATGDAKLRVLDDAQQAAEITLSPALSSLDGIAAAYRSRRCGDACACA